MTALPPAPKTIRVAVQASYGDDLDVLNIFHIAGTTDGPYNETVLSTVADTVYDAWISDFKGAAVAALEYQGAEAKDISVVNGGTAPAVVTGPTPGTAGGTGFPANVSVVISWKEFISYRGGHPRTYLCGIPESVLQDPQHIETTFAADVATAANSFLSAVNGTSAISGFGVPALSVVHYSLNKTAQDPPLVKPILSAICGTRIDSQRRRLGAAA